MPKLVYVVACERILEEQGKGTVTLFSMLDLLNAGIASDAKPESDGGYKLPISWRVVTLWIKDGSESNHEYQQRMEVVDPSNRVIMQFDLPFKHDATTHRNVINVEGIKVTESGLYRVTIKICSKHKQSSKWSSWKDCEHFYPITVHAEHISKASEI